MMIMQLPPIVAFANIVGAVDQPRDPFCANFWRRYRS